MPATDDDVIDRVETKVREKTERPPLYKVILLNDDYTPAGLVMHVLMKAFAMGQDKAMAVMVEAHVKGTSLVSSYQKDVAETKAKQAEDLAKSEGSALKFTVEKD